MKDIIKKAHLEWGLKIGPKSNQDEQNKELVKIIATVYDSVVEECKETINNIRYNREGYGCGIEDESITDRYKACEYGAMGMKEDILNLL